ncbi:hypothetical protein K437DRAFT_258417 [Tilletiaria anomala UBC 951]|uniref:TFIIE beta domain-containing protein n=1 Tax=Tilletiaria anomala (strain ATCC 24038 / CBS 436.72 / UBC 951) TaxID=1037660 RepID=A0A066VHT2_TILAU|nr:uncharacterized protein K437DRAFT_258417 [Tilletiaria anomala UBC 951]KDN41061.1 hypothetical protein K437DRAFT_258417 [Tilletiaria anomala UBC 951]
MSTSGADVYSQPANTGAGRLENTQLASAVDALKRETNPVRLEDFALGLGSGFESLLDRNSSLYSRFANHERVVLNSINGTLTYRPDYELRSKGDLMQLIRDRYDAVYPSKKDVPYGTRRLPLKPVIKMTDLRESWPDVKVAIEQLTKNVPREEREVLVWKQSRDGLIKGVSWNPIRGEEVKDVDQEFRDLWHSFNSPDAVDLSKQLEADGMRVTAILPSASSGMTDSTVSSNNAPISAFGTKGMLHGDKTAATGRGGSGRGRGRGRGGRGSASSTSSSRKPKIQNTHLKDVDLSKDYI